MVYAIIAIVILAAVIAATRKDKSAPGPRTVTFYGDSATYGGHLLAGMLLRYSPDPVAMVQTASNGALICVNRAMNGLKLHELLTGGRVEMAVPTLGEPGDIAPLALQLTTDPSEVIVLGCGNVDALFGTRGVQVFAEDLDQAIALAKQAGKTPVVRGLNRFLVAGPVDEIKLAARGAFHTAARMTAQQAGVKFIDIDEAGEPELCEDQLHPAVEYHQRIAALIARELTK